MARSAAARQPAAGQWQVSVGTATVSLVLHGLGFSTRRLYLVAPFFADTPVEHLLGPGINADGLNDDCLGRTLDWLYAHEVTRLFAGLALRARRAFGVEVGRRHADTTSCSVHGRSTLDLPEAPETAETLNAAAQANQPAEDGADDEAPAVIAVTDGSSRDRREDVKQWMLTLVTSGEGEGVPQFLQPLDGNASDQRALLAAVSALREQLQQSDATAGVCVAESGLSSAEQMTQLNQAGVQWVRRVPETSTAAHTIVQERLQRADEGWQSSAEGTRHWWSRRQPDLPQGGERGVVVRTRQGEDRARATRNESCSIRQYLLLAILLAVSLAVKWGSPYRDRYAV